MKGNDKMHYIKEKSNAIMAASVLIREKVNEKWQ
jgi:hypothetical protein